MAKISIITATYNSEKLLPELIKSLAEQTSKEFEWVVIDGASTDSTVNVIHSAQINSKVIISEPDRGIYDALNKGVRISNSDYYLVVGSDDILHKNAVEKYCSAIESGAPDLITAPVVIGGKTVFPKTFLNRFRSGPPVASAHSVGVLIRKDLHKIHGNYSLQYPVAADTLFLRKVTRSPSVKVKFLPSIAGTFGTNGRSSENKLWTLTDSMRANVAAGESLFLQWFLFSLRLIKNLKKIRKDTARL